MENPEPNKPNKLCKLFLMGPTKVGKSLIYRSLHTYAEGFLRQRVKGFCRFIAPSQPATKIEVQDLTGNPFQRPLIPAEVVNRHVWVVVFNRNDLDSLILALKLLYDIPTDAKPQISVLQAILEQSHPLRYKQDILAAIQTSKNPTPLQTLLIGTSELPTSAPETIAPSDLEQLASQNSFLYLSYNFQDGPLPLVSKIDEVADKIVSRGHSEHLGAVPREFEVGERVPSMKQQDRACQLI